MKKLLVLILSSVLAISLSACKDEENSSDISTQSQSQTESQSQSESQPQSDDSKRSSDVEKALSLIESGDVKEAYKTLFFSDEEDAKEMLSDFIVVSTQDIMYFSENYPETVIRNVMRRYDERGNLVFEDDGSSTTEYTYDENNNVLSINEYLETRVLTENFTYDEKGRRIKQESIQTNSNGTESTYVIESQYDEHDNVVYYKTITDGQYLYETSNTYKYDDEGRVIYKKVEDEFGEEITFAYDERGNLIEKITDKSKKVTYTYDSENRLLSEICDSDFDMEDYRYEYTFDERGNLIKEYRWEYNGNTEKWYEYTFDDENRQVKKSYSHKSGRIDEGYTCEYTYDENGLKIKEVRTDRDEDTEAKATTEFTYDDCGNVIKSIYTSERGNYSEIFEYPEYLYFYRPESK